MNAGLKGILPVTKFMPRELYLILAHFSYNGRRGRICRQKIEL